MTSNLTSRLQGTKLQQYVHLKAINFLLCLFFSNKRGSKKDTFSGLNLHTSSKPSPGQQDHKLTAHLTPADNTMTMSSSKRKRPTPLGVLEFTSALNGEDATLILKKLRHFVKVVRYERKVSLGVTDDGCDDVVVDDDDDGTGGGINQHHGDTEEYGSDEDSLSSLFNSNNTDDEQHNPSAASASSKRQKTNSGKSTTPSWQVDKNDYRVPFVGTSVAKGEVGRVVRGVWPSGFLEGECVDVLSGVESRHVVLAVYLPFLL